MSENIVWIIILLIFVLGGISIVRGSIKQTNAMKVWKQIAAELGLDFQMARGVYPMHMHGELGDTTVLVQKQKPSEGGRARRTLYKAKLGDTVPADLELFPQTFLMKTISSLGAQDIDVGDPDFDGAFNVSCSDPEAARAYLDAAVRSAILRLNDGGFWQIRLKEGYLTVVEKGVEDSPAKLKYTLDALTACARTVGRGAVGGASVAPSQPA